MQMGAYGNSVAKEVDSVSHQLRGAPFSICSVINNGIPVEISPLKTAHCEAFSVRGRWSDTAGERDPAISSEGRCCSVDGVGVRTFHRTCPNLSWQ